MIAFVLLIFVNLWLLYRTSEPAKFTEVKEKYRILREHLQKDGDVKYEMLHRHIPLTGMKRMKNTVGSNTNKGGEIVVCLDGDVNEIFHVVLHELAHCTVKEYSHSPEFWENYHELRDMCVELGIYKTITEKTEFCGQHVQDK